MVALFLAHMTRTAADDIFTVSPLVPGVRNSNGISNIT